MAYSSTQGPMCGFGTTRAFPTGEMMDKDDECVGRNDRQNPLEREFGSERHAIASSVTRRSNSHDENPPLA